MDQDFSVFYFKHPISHDPLHALEDFCSPFGSQPFLIYIFWFRSVCFRLAMKIIRHLRGIVTPCSKRTMKVTSPTTRQSFVARMLQVHRVACFMSISSANSPLFFKALACIDEC